MAGKPKKRLFGADFRDEDVTRKGKPRKRKKADDAANTMQLDTEEVKEAAAEKKRAAAEKSEPAPKPQTKNKAPAFDDFDEIDKETSRVVSVILFAIGILMMFLILIPGTKGWGILHDFVLGFFGFMALVVPIAVIYSAVIISKGKDEGGKIIGTMVMILIVACSAIQIFFVGVSPDDGVGAYISMVYKDGSEFKGGGVLGFPISALLLWGFGRVGATIIMILFIFVFALIVSGKELSDFLGFLTSPFTSFARAVGAVMNDDDEEDDDDEEAEETPYRDHRDEIFDDALYDNEFMSQQNDRKAADEGQEPEQNDEMILHFPEQQPVQPEEASVSAEMDEFSKFFDIPIDEAPVKAPEKGEASENDSDLDKLITKAAGRKPVQEEAFENTKEPEPANPLYILPGLDLLTPPDTQSNSVQAAAEMREKADTIVNTLKSFGVEVMIRNIYRGPSITRYEIQPGAGVKVSKIKGLEDDIALSLAAQGVRIEAPVPGKAAVGIEVPNINKDTVTIREILSTADFRTAQSKLAFAVGKDITGNAIIGDITKMPHVIIAGTTGSGKSVCTRSIIMSILYKAKPDEVKIILIDPKVVEFKVFEGIPHLLIPIVTEAKKAAGALNWAVNEMMRRYNTFADIGANDLKSYNEIAEDDGELPKMPQIVIFIDELADMMLVAGKEVEDSICRLAQMGRAAGMHLVVATQRPTTDVITGLIKANIPSRIALSVMSQVDSRTIIDMAGADKLLGNGDMLYMPIGTSKPVRVQGCFASSKDINATLNFIRSQAEGDYDKQIVEAVENFVPQTKGDHGGMSESGFEAGSDEDYIFRGAEVAVTNGQISTTMLQKKLKLGYARASRIIDELEERGIIGPSEGSKPRKVLMSKMQFDEWRTRMITDN